MKNKVISIDEKRRRKEKISEFKYDELAVGARLGFSVAVCSLVYASACVWMICLRSFLNSISYERR